MKIRLKRVHAVEREVAPDVFQNAIGTKIYGWSANGLLEGEVTCFLPEYWEPVPEEEWVDVTERCYLADRGRTVFDDQGTKLVLAVEDGYRLRKVKMNEHETDTPCRKAFIVEKRVPSKE